MRKRIENDKNTNLMIKAKKNAKKMKMKTNYGNFYYEIAPLKGDLICFKLRDGKNITDQKLYLKIAPENHFRFR